MTTEEPNPPATEPATPAGPDYPPPPGWALQRFNDGRPPEYAPPPGYAQYAQPAVYAPPTPAPDSMGGAAITGLVIAILSLSLSAIPSCGAIFIGLGILFSALGLISRRRRVVAIIGLTISLLAMGIAIWLFIPY